MSWTKDNGKFAKDAAEQALLQVNYLDEKKPLIDKFTNEQTNLQAQINQLVADGDSSPEAAQARVGVDDTEYRTLKARLDEEYKQNDVRLSNIAIDVVQFGAVGDGENDDTQAIQDAIVYGTQHKLKVIATGDFKITDTIHITCDVDFSLANFFMHDNPSVAISIGNPSLSKFDNKTILLPKTVTNVSKTSVGWGSFGIGVRAVNLYSCFVKFGNVKNFKTNFSVVGDGTGNVYNEYHLSHLENGMVNLEISAINSGWVNENNFYGGRLSQYSDEGVNVTGVRHIKISKSINAVNNNVFYKPSIEGNVPEYHVENGGSYNTIIQARWESSPPKVLYTGDNANQGVHNAILYGYNSHSIVVTRTGSASTRNILYSIDSVRHRGASVTGLLKYGTSGASTDKIISLYEPSVDINAVTNESNQYSIAFTPRDIIGRRNTDSFDRIDLNFYDGRIFFGNGSSATTRSIGNLGTAWISSNSIFIPNADNSFSLGTANYRWSEVFAGTGTINTSDRNHKQQIGNIPDEVLDAWAEVNYQRFKFNDAVDKKGANARYHIGVIAQDIKEAFERHNLNAFEYGILCYDEWNADDEIGLVEGGLYSIRADECQFLELALMRRELNNLKKSIIQNC